MIGNEISWRRRWTRVLFVLPAFLVVALMVVAQGTNAGENVGDGDEVNESKQVAVTKHKSEGFERTLKTLKADAGVLVIQDAPLSDLIAYFSKSRHLQFEFESNDIKKRRVTIDVSSEKQPQLTLRDTLLSLFEHFNCEMLILPNGNILVRKVSTDSTSGQ